MIGIIGHPCRSPGCSVLAPEGAAYCKAHQRQGEQPQPKERGKSRNLFYSTAGWQKARKAKLQLNPVCEICGRALATVVHHIKRLDEAPELAVELTNLQAVCDPCHNRTRQAEGIEARRNSGRLRSGAWLYQCKVTVVCGPPAAGKTTWVKGQLIPGDLVLDLDLIFTAVTMQELRFKPKALLRPALAAYYAILDALPEARDLRAWIINSTFDATRRQEFADHGARVVVLKPPVTTCIDRVISRGNHAQEVEAVKDWFANFAAAPTDEVIGG